MRYLSVRHGVGISMIDRDNAAHISFPTPRTDLSFAGTPRGILARTSWASKGDRSPSFCWRRRRFRGAAPGALRGQIFRTLADGIDIIFWKGSGEPRARRWRGWNATRIRRKSPLIDFFKRGSSNFLKNAKVRRPKSELWQRRGGARGETWNAAADFVHPTRR